MTDEEYVKLAHPDADVHGQQSGVYSEYRVKLMGQWPTEYLSFYRWWAKSHNEAWADARARLTDVTRETHLTLKEVPAAAQLAALRAESEAGLVPMTVLVLKVGSLRRVLVVLRNPEPRGIDQSEYPDTRIYHCHRYWRSSGDWDQSFDEQRCSLERAFRWLAESNVRAE